MNKFKCQTRFDSRLTGIPYDNFRYGTITKGQGHLWKKKINNYRNKGGEYYVVAFDRSCTALEIDAKAQDVCMTQGWNADLIIIDYLNNMKPIGRYQSAKNWDAIGEISGDLKDLAKSWDNKNGTRVVTANQAKDGASNSETFTKGNVSYSPVPFDDATIVLGLTQTEIQKAIDQMTLHIVKHRDGKRGDKIRIFNNFEICKFHDTDRELKFEEDLEANE